MTFDRAPTVPSACPGTVANLRTTVPRAPLFRGGTVTVTEPDGRLRQSRFSVPPEGHTR
jgi:hypothetical protein